ncbi:MAG: prolipoprotein diacylglyceryl transferase, partial [Gammaproteobacteria bacterium]|nr:prolipoprotein diacylglyceryl transferase [Gammaproteobacteria bacterium]
MLTFPEINPVALDLGPVKVHWYGVMYLLAFAQFYFLGKWRAQQNKSGWTAQEVSDLVFYGAMGV